ncbi:MAG: transposase family protein [Nitrospinae bacterium]|nr:transposase family protein [Nitrospinota bacterium]
MLFILVYLKTYALQVVHGRLFGMGQSKANQWMHVLLGVLRATLRALGDAPTMSVRALAQRLRVAVADEAIEINSMDTAYCGVGATCLHPPGHCWT